MEEKQQEKEIDDFETTRKSYDISFKTIWSGWVPGPASTEKLKDVKMRNAGGWWSPRSFSAKRLASLRKSVIPETRDTWEMINWHVLPKLTHFEYSGSLTMEDLRAYCTKVVAVAPDVFKGTEKALFTLIGRMLYLLHQRQRQEASSLPRRPLLKFGSHNAPILVFKAPNYCFALTFEGKTPEGLVQHVIDLSKGEQKYFSGSLRQNCPYTGIAYKFMEQWYQLYMLSQATTSDKNNDALIQEVYALLEGGVQDLQELGNLEEEYTELTLSWTKLMEDLQILFMRGQREALNMAGHST